ncbi:UTP--glucose-1-phosphate uridylyltransferase [Dehalogenimonas formicexedens]|uniref:UTP--glucose-1-phosphate uridylyltransferase n=1 Tax=Dehalogenimonas formicexedens TaxID=1839801 RepID=A0A1P8F601_9CHLR|nr:UTP--glucose-1-phosphate uridylyltransferase GalU [Dehalogenimonas formicexedens]APV43860.1 UTP--glucose-1-phosphate uridylyltransferase [Dehalogenimonas formicexedens]
MNEPVNKAVIVAAGYGTRFLPITKSVPKEMLPLLSRPLIQYIVDEAVASGISDVVFVISQGKETVVDYFRPSPKLESFLVKKGDAAGLHELRSIPSMARFSHVYQSEPLGLGHAIASASEAICNEPFAAILPDDIIDSDVPVLRQMLDVYQQYPGNLLLVEECRPEETNRYGIIDAEIVDEGVYRVRNLVEKPSPEEAPSNLAIIGRYILMPEIFKAISMTKPGKGGEIQLTDAIRRLAASQPVYACKFRGTRFDAGTPEGWLKANIAWAEKENAGN